MEAWYTVKRGDTASGIRRKLKKVNDMTVADITRVVGSPPVVGKKLGYPYWPPKRTALARTGYVNVNTALAAQLVSLPGIGAVKARAIVRHRKKHGRFKKSEHLIDVKGIGKKTHTGLKRHVKLTG